MGVRDQFSETAKARLVEIREQQRGLSLEEIDILVSELRRLDSVKHGNVIALITAMRQKVASADLHDPQVRSQLIAMALANSPLVHEVQSKANEN